MVVFPNCKINLGLQILGKREDGYHNLETVFYPLPFYDALEIVKHPDYSFNTSGHDCGNPENNLCTKAYHLIRNEFPQLPNIQMYLHKAIPTGAGLGGGSSDGAFVLKLLNDIFNLNIDNQKLRAYALKLGSDCPFFILNKPCLATGRGEQMIEIPLNLKGYFIKLVMPGIHISTQKHFQTLSLSRPITPVSEAILMPIQDWKYFLGNDFEKDAFLMYPVLKKIKERLYEDGAAYASMSGTGSTMYGLFNTKPDYSEKEEFPSKWLAI